MMNRFSKPVEKEFKIDTNTATSICIRNGYKVGPTPFGNGFRIVVDLPDGKKKVYPKVVSSKEVSAAMTKTYKFYAMLIIQKQKENAEQTSI